MRRHRVYPCQCEACYQIFMSTTLPGPGICNVCQVTGRLPQFRDKKTGRFRECRLSNRRMESFCDDPMTREMGVDTSEFTTEWRKQDVRDGCPHCTAEVAENASEPDVMSRWGFRR